MKRNDAEQIGKLIQQYLRQESLESPLNEQRLLDPISVNSADAVQAEILNEYRREFIAEGQLFFYHKRMKDEKLNGYTVNYVFPKPDTEIEFGK